jgi:hypothetical protein
MFVDVDDPAPRAATESPLAEFRSIERAREMREFLANGDDDSWAADEFSKLLAKRRRQAESDPGLEFDASMTKAIASSRAEPAESRRDQVRKQLVAFKRALEMPVEQIAEVWARHEARHDPQKAEIIRKCAKKVARGDPPSKRFCDADVLRRATAKLDEEEREVDEIRRDFDDQFDT